MRTKIAAIVLTMVALAAVATSGTSGQSEFRYALIQRSCAPWDGAAIEMTLTKERATCQRRPAPYIEMGVWKGLPIQPGQVVKFAAISDVGFASRCERENDCVRAESGEITFDTYKDGVGASGSYVLHFKGGETVSGSFDAKWCEMRVMCG